MGRQTKRVAYKAGSYSCADQERIGEGEVTPDEIYKLKIDAALRAHERETGFGNAANKAAVDSGAQALKSIFLVNGGSCVAILAFIGTLATKYRPVSEFAFPLIVFALGAGFAILATGAGYFTNICIEAGSRNLAREYEEPFLRAGDKSKRSWFWASVFRCLSVGFGILGLTSFFYGLYAAYSAFRYL